MGKERGEEERREEPINVVVSVKIPSVDIKARRMTLDNATSPYEMSVVEI